jgi:hypothetical protein
MPKVLGVILLFVRLVEKEIEKRKEKKRKAKHKKEQDAIKYLKRQLQGSNKLLLSDNN